MFEDLLVLDVGAVERAGEIHGSSNDRLQPAPAVRATAVSSGCTVNSSNTIADIVKTAAIAVTCMYNTAREAAAAVSG